MKNKNKIGVVILAGGKSERMNFPKPYLMFDDKNTFLEKIIEEYIDFDCKGILVVLNHELLYGKWKQYLENISEKIILVQNHYPELGRFYSLKLGLSKLKNCDYCFLQNVDNPFVTAEMLNKLFQNKNENGFTVPYYNDMGGHPILLSKNVIDQIKKIKQDDSNLKGVLINFQKKKVKVSDEKILANINTKEEYEKHFHRHCDPEYSGETILN